MTLPICTLSYNVLFIGHCLVPCENLCLKPPAMGSSLLLKTTSVAGHLGAQELQKQCLTHRRHPRNILLNEQNLSGLTFQFM